MLNYEMFYFESVTLASQLLNGLNSTGRFPSVVDEERGWPLSTLKGPK